MTWIAIAAGGALGSIARELVGMAFSRTLGHRVPYAVACVNLAGCFLIGLFLGMVARGPSSDTTRAFVAVGLLGGFTTFSSFGVDTVALLRGGQIVQAATNVLVQVLGGIAAVFVGYALAAR